MINRVWIYNGAGDFSYETRELPPCGENDVILKTVFSTVCGSDLIAWRRGGEAENFLKGYELGHECCARIVEMGNAVEGFELGQRVFPFPQYCVVAPAKGCQLGAFSDYIYVPNAKKNFNLYPVDDSFSDEEVALIEPLGVARRAAVNTDPGPGKTALVWGCGGIGLGAAMMLSVMGCDRVVMLDLLEEKLELARSFGFETVNVTRETWLDDVEALLGKRYNLWGRCINADIIMEATGSEVVFQQAYRLAPPGGTLQLVSIYDNPQLIDTRSITYTETKLVGGGGIHPEDVLPVIDMLRSERYDVSKLISVSFRQEELLKAVESSVGSNYVKIGIDFR